MKIAVFTAITGARDKLSEDQNLAGADFIAFLDQPFEATKWTVRPGYSLFRDPVRNAKIHKVLAHQYLPGYDFSLWIDGNIRLLAPVAELIDACLKEADIAMFPHPSRDCLYDEALVCAELGLDDPRIIEEQVRRYREAGYPPRNGLHEAGVILRRHSPAIRSLPSSPAHRGTARPSVGSR